MLRKKYTHKKRVKKSGLSRQTGGRVLGVGADGCVFTEPAWPCTEDIPGYDSSDPTIVSKIVLIDDNEDKMIEIASRILVDNPEVLVKNIGVCIPASRHSVLNAEQKAKLLENRHEIIEMVDERSSDNACTELAMTPSKNIKTTYKALINKRYTSDLYHYIRANLKTVNIASKIITAAIPFGKALEKLMKEGSGNRISKDTLVNMDLHSSNIFVQDGLTLGMADYGRCTYIDSTKNEIIVELNDRFTEYAVDFPLAFGFVHIPLEVRIYSFLLKDDFIEYVQSYTKATGDVDAHIIDVFTHTKKFIDDIINKYDILFLLGSVSNIQSFIKTYFLDFTNVLHKIIHKERKTAEEHKFIMLNVISRFYITGYINTILIAIKDTDEFLAEKRDLIIAVHEYILHDDASKFSGSIISQFVKLYFDLLILPYKNIELTSVSEYIWAVNRRMESLNFASELDGIRISRLSASAAPFVPSASAPSAAPFVPSASASAPSRVPIPYSPITPLESYRSSHSAGRRMRRTRRMGRTKKKKNK